MQASFRYCPQCAAPLRLRTQEDGSERLCCSQVSCAFVHRESPTPVIAAVVEYAGKLVLARNARWAQRYYGPITGFLEKTDPSPAAAALREVREELGLQGQGAQFIGHYRFAGMNQLILGYHVPAAGELHANQELADLITIAPAHARYWPEAAGLALRDWLRARGYDPRSLLEAED